MARFFNFFPKTFYSSNNKTTNLEIVTNITSRFSFEEKLKENAASFYEYEIKDGDTPEIIAHKYYNNVERHWIVLMFNDIIDPQFDWPLKYSEFNEYVDSKYSAPEYADTANTSVSGLSWARNVSNEHSFYKVIQVINTSDGTTSTTKLEVDEAQYQNIAATTVVYTLQNGSTIRENISKEIKTHYDYENELNENKRKIKLLKKEFVPIVEKEFKRVISQ